MAEYSTTLATTPQVSYLTSDHLGSPRVITNELGQVTTRKDYMAFGDEASSTQRTSGLKYDSSETRKGYTGYEKDEESGLEFAQARYYNTTHGRFTSVDPLTASANVKNPQTFNRYSYVLNSPYKFTDPLGLISSSTGACGNWCQGNDGGGGGYGGSYDSGHRSGVEGSNLEFKNWLLGNGAPLSFRRKSRQTQDDPQWVRDVRNAFPSNFTETERNQINEAIADANNSTNNPFYSAILITQFRRQGDTTTPSQATSQLQIGQVVVSRDEQGVATNAEPVGTIFDGRNSTYLVDDDLDRNTPDITVSEYFRRNPTVDAIHYNGFIFLGEGFFSERNGRDGRAKDLIHEGVVHRGFGRVDGEFDPNRRIRHIGAFSYSSVFNAIVSPSITSRK